MAVSPSDFQMYMYVICWVFSQSLDHPLGQTQKYQWIHLITYYTPALWLKWYKMDLVDYPLQYMYAFKDLDFGIDSLAWIFSVIMCMYIPA